MDSAIDWNKAEGNPLADRNPYVGSEAAGDGVFGRLLSAIDDFSVVPTRSSTAVTTSWCSIVMAAP